MKKCVRCKQRLRIAEFTMDRTKRDGHSIYCRACARNLQGATAEGEENQDFISFKPVDGVIYCNICSRKIIVSQQLVYPNIRCKKCKEEYTYSALGTNSDYWHRNRKVIKNDS